MKAEYVCNERRLYFVGSVSNDPWEFYTALDIKRQAVLDTYSG
jgi:hypothetical protein